jgi:hypothetical protein
MCANAKLQEHPLRAPRGRQLPARSLHDWRHEGNRTAMRAARGGMAHKWSKLITIVSPARLFRWPPFACLLRLKSLAVESSVVVRAIGDFGACLCAVPW